jgi:hypothetical protein
MPSDWDSAPLSFQISTDGVSFSDLFRSDGTEVAPNITPLTMVPLAGDFAVTQKTWLWLRSGGRAAPVVQSADRVFLIA